MLCELRVENLLLIERAELELVDGLNVLTGETGAGKTVLAQALDFLMGAHPPNPPRPSGPPAGEPRSAGAGGRRRSPAAGIVRPGAESAYVEGVFAVPAPMREQIAALLPEPLRAERAASGCEELVLARRIGADGRTRAFVGGRAASAADLRELGSRLVSFYGQHEHRKLVLAAAQLQMLDAVCDRSATGQPAHRERLGRCAAAYARTRTLQAELERLAELELARERELDLLEHELREIDAAEPDEREHTELLARRERLRAAETLRMAAAAALAAIAPEDGVGAGHLLAGAASSLQGPGGVDPELDALAERAQALSIEADDLATAVRCYQDSVDPPYGADGGSDGSLQIVEERLAALERLMRKHGGTLAAVREHAERARERVHELTAAEQAQVQVREALERERATLREHALALRSARAQAAAWLAAAVRDELAALAMPDASFQIELSEAELRASGADAVEFTIAPNPGVAATPLRETASGGELSRVMLALAGACEQACAGTHGAREYATLVFDEIDAGIGGHTARAVGARLQALARSRQLICITHLPQIASLADRHFAVRKASDAGTTLATVTQLAQREIEGELVRMLGAQHDDAGARRHARELRRAA